MIELWRNQNYFLMKHRSAQVGPTKKTAGEIFLRLCTMILISKDFLATIDG